MPQKLIHARTNCSALYFLTELMHDACTVRYVELTAGKKWPRPWRAWPYVATIYGLNVRGTGGRPQTVGWKMFVISPGSFPPILNFQELMARMASIVVLAMR